MYGRFRNELKKKSFDLGSKGKRIPNPKSVREAEETLPVAHLPLSPPPVVFWTPCGRKITRATSGKATP
jgi:hypothetical protein